MPSFKQFSFSAGELAPALHARSDQARYVTGLATCRNMICLKSGGVTNRPGTEYLGSVKEFHSLSRARLIPFVYDNDTSYVIEMAVQRFRFWRDGELLRTGDLGITISPWSALTTYEFGDVVSYGGLNYFARGRFAGVNLNLQPDLFLDPWSVMDDDIVEADHAFGSTSLRLPTYTQSGNIVTFAMNGLSLGIPQLQRFTDRWTYEYIDFAPTITEPIGVAIAGSAGAKSYRYCVTAIDTDTFVESLPGTGASTGSAGTSIVKNVTGIGVTGTRIDFTSVAHGFASGDIVRADGFSTTANGWQANLSGINGRRWTVLRLGANTFSLVNVRTGPVFARSGGGYFSTTAYGGGGTITSITALNTGIATPTTANPITVSWAESPNAREYNVYRESNGIFGYIGTSRTTSFVDDGITPDTSTTPPINQVIFLGSDDSPGAVGYVQQRMVFGASRNEPEKIWMSRTGDFHNFSPRYPSQDDDPFSFGINGGRSQSKVRHFLEVSGKMIVLAEGGIWSVEGDAAGAITPSSINARQQGFIGASYIRPITVNNTVLYYGARTPYLYEIRFDISTGYPTRDLSVFSAHLFDGKTPVDTAYQESPYSVAWTVLEDGALLGMTYVPEQEIAGWHRHDTGEAAGDGFESVCVVPEDGDDAMYAVVRRTVNGSTVRYMERFKPRAYTTIEDDAWFVDCGLHYDGTNATVHTMTLSGGTAWDTSETLTLTASVASFGVGAGLIPAGDVVRITVGDDVLDVTLLSVTSSTVAMVRPEGLVVAGMRTTALTTWSWARITVPVAHLIGRTVSILADGQEQAQQVVDVSGNITLGTAAVKITTGLPYRSEIETLDPETPQAVLTDRRKRVASVTVQVQDSRGFQTGTDADHLFPWLQGDGGDLTGLDTFTGKVEVAVAGDYGSNTGRIIIRQDSPLPLTVLAAIPVLDVGG